MQKVSLFFIILFFFIIIGLYSDIHKGTAGSISYYQSEISNKTSNGNVGPDGSISYVYPMGKVSAQYTSQTGRWTVGITSVISRDTSWGPPGYTDSDIFLFDGMELVYAEGTNPRIYHTRKESYARIEYWNPGQDDSYWIVRGKKGSWNYYGNTDDSRIEAINKPMSQPRVWAISLTHDAGNFNMTKYFYTEDTENGAFYLEKIVNGKTAAAELGYEAVELFYGNSTTGYISYREGAKVKVEKSVKSVIHKIGCNNNGDGGVIKRAQSLTWAYMAKTMAPVISAITEYGADVIIDENGNITEGSSLSPTTFEYSGITSGFGADNTWECSDKWNLRYSTYPGNNSWFDFMDINGDGLMDRVKQGHDDTVSGDSGHDDFRFRVQLNTGEGFAPTEVWPSNGNYLRHYNTLMLTTLPFDIYTCYTYDYMDINGDGRPDRVWQLLDSLLNVQFNTGNGFGSTENIPSQGPSLRLIRNGDTIYDYFDMNGDGLPDRVGQLGSNLYIRFNNGKEFGPSQEWQSSGNYLREIDSDDGHTLYDYMDMNGDGLSDRIWQNNDDKLYIKYNTGSGFETDAVMFNTQDKYIRRVVTSEDTMEAHTASDYMDINGDGLPDRLVQSNSSTLTVRFNTGSGFSPPVAFPSTGNYLRQSDFYYNTHLKDYFDMNGDGFLDRVYRNSKYPDFDDPLHIRFSESEYPRENFLLQINHPAGGFTSYSYKPVDKSLNPGYKFNKWVIKSITTEDGFGNEEKIEYEYFGGLLDTASKEDKGFQKVTNKNSTGGFTETFYYQSGPESGLIEKIIERSETGKIIKYLYNIYEDYAVRSDHYGYDIVQGRDNAGPEVVVQAVKLVETNEYNVDGNTENDLGTMPDGIHGDDWHNRKKEITYDSYGNKTKITSGDYTNGEWTLDKNEQYIEYINSTEYWMFLPMREYEYSYNNNDMFVMSDDKRIFYDNSEEYGEINGQGLPTKIQLYRSETDFITKRIVYNEYGNIIETIDPKGNSTTYEYDPIFRIYKTKETSPGVNGINLVIQTEYNTHCLPDKIINPNNSVTELFYDTFYRLIKKVLPYDSETCPTEVYEYHEADNSTDGDGTKFPWIKKITREVENTTESFEIYSYMDGMGRTIQTKAEAINDAGSPCWLTVNNWQYIMDGKRIKAASTPFYSSQCTFDRPLIPAGVCTYEKVWFSENEGHVTLKQNSSSTPLVSRIVTKLNKTVSMDADGHIRITTIKPWENKTSVITYTGEFPNNEIYSQETTKITFDVTTTTDFEGNLIYNTKNWLGNTLLMWDGDTGEIRCHYDDNGNIIDKTDAKGNVITYLYDALNRLTEKMLPGGNSIHYYYDGIDETIGIPFSGDHGEGLGKLTRVVLQNGIDGENYTYDSRGRIVKIAKIIDGERRFMEVVYDSMDRVVKEILPDGEEVMSCYSNGGMLTSIVGDESYVTDLIYTASGQIDSMTYGNGIITSYNYFDEEDEYDPSTNLNLTYLLESIHTSDGSTMDLNYRYDRSGNIIMKNNLLDDDLSEDFIYDDLNRLIEAESPMYGTKTYEYDTINNIKKKDGYEYQYHENKPHAVVSDGRNTYTYDANGNMIQAAGHSTITIRAKGTGVSEEPPEMELWLAGEKKMKWVVSNSEYHEFTWKGWWNGESTIDIAFTNDNQAGGEETNLFIEWIEVNGERMETVSDDLEGYWNFDEGTGTIAGDTSGNGNHGTINNAAWSDGKYGSGLYFDGTATVDLGGSMFGIDLTNEFSISLWMKREGIPLSSLIKKAQDIYPFMIETQSGGNIRGCVRLGDGTHYLTTNGISGEAEWTHVAYTYKNGERIIYINGIEDNSDAITGMLLCNTEPTIIGQDFTGTLDDVRIYKRALSNDEVERLAGGKILYDKGAYPDGCFDWLNVYPGTGMLNETGALRIKAEGIPVLNRSMIYDAENRLTSVTENGNTSTYYYDAGGQRIKKTENGIETYYFFKNYEEVIESGSTKKIFYYYANNQCIVQRIITGTDNKLLYIHTDHLGSSVKLTDETGGTVQVIAYDPYGKTVYYEGVNELSYQYTGQEFDKGTGLYYYNDRYYDPSLGRFISPDPVLAGLNRYTYCYNNPVMYTDPSDNNPLIYFLVYSIGSYLSGVSSSGSWNPATWSKDVWKSSLLWPLQAVNGMSWSSNGSVDVYYTSGGSGTIYDPGAMASELMYYAWETGFYDQLTAHMRYYTKYKDDGQSGELYAMGITDSDSDKFFREKWVERMYSIILSEMHTPVSTVYSSTLDIMGIVPDLLAIGLHEIGYEIWSDGFLHSYNDTSWNMALGEFKMAYGQWVQNTSVGIINNKNEKYFKGINFSLEASRDKYLQYLKRAGVDIENIDIKKLDYE